MKMNWNKRAFELVGSCHAGNRYRHVPIIEYALIAVERETLEWAAKHIELCCMGSAKSLANDIRKLSIQEDSPGGVTETSQTPGNLGSTGTPGESAQTMQGKFDLAFVLRDCNGNVEAVQRRIDRALEQAGQTARPVSNRARDLRQSLLATWEDMPDCEARERARGYLDRDTDMYESDVVSPKGSTK